MKNQFKLILVLTCIIFACKTEEPQNPPTVITKIASDVTTTNATLSGEVIDEGSSGATDRGFVYSYKNSIPSVSDTKVQSGFGKGIYSIVLDKLVGNVKYYYKAYAVNTKGISYGEVKNFITVVEVKSKTGRIWMDRNLGATRVATSSTDEASYGDLYQWGRGADGHQKITSGTTSIMSSTDSPGNGLFICKYPFFQTVKTVDIGLFSTFSFHSIGVKFPKDSWGLL